ncbi:MAG: hypothetical protein ACI87M_000864, partial [Yoonia sp.]
TGEVGFVNKVFGKQNQNQIRSKAPPHLMVFLNVRRNPKYTSLYFELKII